jgi:hypothetical protein
MDLSLSRFVLDPLKPVAHRCEHEAEFGPDAA